MRVVGLGSIAVLALTVSAEAQELDRWRPADCASLEANSLEAALLKCDPASLLRPEQMSSGSARETSDHAASWSDRPDEDLPLDLPASDGKPPAIEISSKNW